MNAEEKVNQDLDTLLQDPAISSICIMTDPDLHPLPITPNDPLSIFSTKMPYGQKKKSTTPESKLLGGQGQAAPTEPVASFDMEISNSVADPSSMFESALPSLKLNTEAAPQSTLKQVLQD